VLMLNLLDFNCSFHISTTYSTCNVSELPTHSPSFMINLMPAINEFITLETCNEIMKRRNGMALFIFSFCHQLFNRSINLSKSFKNILTSIFMVFIRASSRLTGIIKGLTPGKYDMKYQVSHPVSARLDCT